VTRLNDGLPIDKDLDWGTVTLAPMLLVGLLVEIESSLATINYMNQYWLPEIIWRSLVHECQLSRRSLLAHMKLAHTRAFCCLKLHTKEV
jgi:hypothetical protein